MAGSEDSLVFDGVASWVVSDDISCDGVSLRACSSNVTCRD